MVLGGCDPSAVETFTVVGSTTERSFLVPERTNVGADPILLRSTALDVAAVRYRLDDQRRAFLFTGDLRSGITSGAYLLLPDRSTEPSEATVDIAPFDSTKWGSFRVYDAGLCSLPLAWSAGGDGLGFIIGVPPLAELLVGAIDDAFTSGLGVLGGRRVSEGRVTPILRADGGTAGLSEDTDAVRIEATYFATRIQAPSGVNLGCDNVTVTMRVEVGFERGDGGISNAPGCLQPGDPGGFLQTDDGFTYEFDGVVYDVAVQVSTDWCSLPGLADAITSGLDASLRTGLPGAVRLALLDAALVDPRTLGFAAEEIPSCTCDIECNEFAPGGAVYGFEGGRRPRCHFDGEPRRGEGECWIQLEIDRLNVRPDSLEVVLMEDASDRQYALLPDMVRDFVCAPNRADYGTNFRDPPRPLESTLTTPYVVPAP